MSILMFLNDHMSLIVMLLTTCVSGLTLGGFGTRNLLSLASKIVAMVAQEALSNEEKRKLAIDKMYEAMPTSMKVLPKAMVGHMIEFAWQKLVKDVLSNTDKSNG